jgi:altronate dehydratase
MAAKVIIINPRDNVAIALTDLKKGVVLELPDGREVLLAGDIPYSHKVALRDIPKGADVIKYGEIIGEAKEPIKKGEWVHTHNLDIQAPDAKDSEMAGKR